MKTPPYLWVYVYLLLSATVLAGQPLTIQPMLPAGAAPYTVTQHDSGVAPGYYFTGSYTFSLAAQFPSSLMIMDATGYPVYYTAYPFGDGTFADLRVYPNGLMSYFLFREATLEGKYFIMDSTFTVIDSVACGNALKTDGHELIMTDDDHYYLICLEERILDLSAVLTEDGFPGDTDAVVIGPVIQELDENKNVLFEWRGLDYYALNDIDAYFFLDPDFMDFGHPNAIAFDANGDLLFSLRFFNEITKISRTDSSIIWRLGGKQNQFTFLNTALTFSAQHNVEVLPNGNITMFDNGELSSPFLARAVEYQLDETNLTATEVWSFDNTPGIMSYALGSAQRLQNGNTVISWGAGLAPGFANDFMEVSLTGDTLLTFDYPQDYFIYRTYKNETAFDMEAVRPKIICDTTGGIFLTAAADLDNYLWNNGDTVATIAISDTGVYYYYTEKPNGYFYARPWIVEDMVNPCQLIEHEDSIIDTVGLYASIEKPAFTFYPNPANRSLTIEGKWQGTQPPVLRLYNAIGEVLITATFESAYRQQIDLQYLPNGLYFGEIHAGNNRQTFKVSVQH